MINRTIRSVALVLALGITVAAPAQAADGGQAKAVACGACHGADGNSVNPDWPNLAGQHPGYLVAQLHAFKSGARKNPNMNAMAAPLSDQDMADIAGYFAAQGPTISSVEGPELAAGAALYRGGNAQAGTPACMACHAPDGAGNPAAGYPALRGQHAKYTALQLRAYDSGERSTDQKSIMRTIAARMSDAEIDSVAKFIEGLH